MQWEKNNNASQLNNKCSESSDVIFYAMIYANITIQSLPLDETIVNIYFIQTLDILRVPIHTPKIDYAKVNAEQVEFRNFC